MEVIDMGKKADFLLTPMTTWKPSPVPMRQGIERAFSADAESRKTNFGTLHATVASRFENESTTYNPKERRCINEGKEVLSRRVVRKVKESQKKIRIKED
jgi:hypothetical protein